KVINLPRHQAQIMGGIIGGLMGLFNGRGIGSLSRELIFVRYQNWPFWNLRKRIISIMVALAYVLMSIIGLRWMAQDRPVRRLLGIEDAEQNK
ncbi:MAG: hypothetical protein KDE51_00355, partial [Anaerolineales bacterium]|nr:hypothetical protein [Anaerolineales bacterium]